MNPPDLLRFADFGGDWAAYEAELNRVFMDEIARAGLVFRGEAVNCRRHAEVAGRWASYWHLVQEGRVEDDRTPDLRRCERLRWVPWVCVGKRPASLARIGSSAAGKPARASSARPNFRRKRTSATSPAS